MKVHEIISLHKDLLRVLASKGVNTTDHAYYDMFSDFSRMKEEGMKVSFIVAHLADEYSVSESTVYNVVRKFETNI